MSKRKPFDSPVLVVDALGLSNEIKSTDHEGLLRIVEKLDRQYHQFRAKIPHHAMFVHRWRIWGSRDFAAIRLNDMFAIYSPRRVENPALRYLIASTLLYQTLLRAQVIPRGGLGYGSLVKSRDVVLGTGLVDAYETSERRADGYRDICAIKISANFLRRMPPSQKAWKLVCFYKGQFFVHPFRLVDPEIGEFDRKRVLNCLRSARINGKKLSATEQFLDGFEDYEAAEALNSETRKFSESFRPETSVRTPASSSAATDPKAHGIELETWNRETVGFRDRIGSLYEKLNAVGPAFSRLPSAPLDFQPTEIGAMKYQLCVIAIGAARSAQELLSSISLLAVTGNFLSASVCTRLLIELLGQLEFADQKVLHCLDRPGELEAAKARLQRLLHGSKSSGPALPGGMPDIAVINVMDFVRAAEVAKPGMQKLYDFLCYAAHPNYTKHGYLLFAGSEYDNWRNPIFAVAARGILDRTVEAAEQAISGIAESAIRLVEDCLPQILAERRKQP
jgi:hypothetical protein